MADLTGMFARLFSSIDQRQQQIQNQPFYKSAPLMPKDDSADKVMSNALYPEKAGARIREQKAKKEKEYRDFLKSLTDGEINNLRLLKRKSPIVIDRAILKSCGENGDDIEMDRLEQYSLVKRELIPDDGLIEFRITSKGRQIYEDLGLDNI